MHPPLILRPPYNLQSEHRFVNINRATCPADNVE